MAWNETYGTRSYRKEMSAHRRSQDAAAAIATQADNDSKGRKKRVRCDARKFGLEYKGRNPASAGSLFSEYNEWQKYWTRYETSKQRDQALEAMNRRNDLFIYRPINF